MKPSDPHKPANLQTVLERRMRTERVSFSPAPGFTERVMDNLDQTVTIPQPPTFPAWRLVVGLATAACVVFLALRFVPSAPEPSAAPARIASLKLPEITAEKVEAFTARLDEPLEIELKNVISDTRQAIQFVASNFLPEN